MAILDLLVQIEEALQQAHEPLEERKKKIKMEACR